MSELAAWARIMSRVEVLAINARATAYVYCGKMSNCERRRTESRALQYNDGCESSEYARQARYADGLGTALLKERRGSGIET